MQGQGKPQPLKSGNQANSQIRKGSSQYRFLLDLEVQEPKLLGLPRKEVIQPHLPVRLPCYDFTPITDPTLDACLPKGLAGRLQVLPTFVV